MKKKRRQEFDRELDRVTKAKDYPTYHCPNCKKVMKIKFHIFKYRFDSHIKYHCDSCNLYWLIPFDKGMKKVSFPSQEILNSEFKRHKRSCKSCGGGPNDPRQ